MYAGASSSATPCPGTLPPSRARVLCLSAASAVVHSILACLCSASCCETPKSARVGLRVEGEAVSAAALVFPPVLKCFFDDDDDDDDDCPVASFGVAGVVLFDPASDCGKSNGAFGVTGVPTRAVCFLISWPCLTGLTCRGVTSSSSGLLQAVRTKPQEVGMRLRDKEGGGEAMADTLTTNGRMHRPNLRLS